MLIYMSNPPSVLPPNPYFNGIIYNPTDYLSVSADSVLTYGQATSLFIQKTIADSVSGITNFVNGITSSSILAKTISATCNLWTNATGEIFIGTLGGRSALIHIGDGDSNLAGSGVHINNGLNTASNVQILNGTGSTGTINLGSSTSTTNVNCPLTLTYAPSLLTGTNMIGYTTTDAITASTIANSTATGTFTSSVLLSSGVWLINYSLRLEPTSGSTTITLFSAVGSDSNSVVYAQTSLGFTNVVSNSGQGLCSNGSFVIKSNGTITYNVVVYAIHSGGTSFGFVKTGSNPSLVQRTRIG